MPISGGGGIITVTAGAAFTPASLSNLHAWYKADAGVYSDAGTTLAVNNDPVQQWNDQSGNNFHLTQATSAKRPNYLTNTLNGLPVLDFVAANGDFLQVSGLTNGTNLASAFIVVKWTVADPNGRLLGFAQVGGSDTNNVSWMMYTPSSLTAVRTFENGDKSVGTVTSSTWNQIGTIFDGSNDTMYINNSAQTPVAYTDTFNAVSYTFELMSNETGGENLTGQIAEVVVTKSAINSTDRANLASYFTNKWAV